MSTNHILVYIRIHLSVLVASLETITLYCTPLNAHKTLYLPGTLSRWTFLSVDNPCVYTDLRNDNLLLYWFQDVCVKFIQ